jgi:sarcosine oxidase
MSDDTFFDAIVIGAGVMGSSTARWLSSQGRRVALLEQFEIGHTRGSSHGRSRIFRFSYPDSMYVAMAMESQGLWRDAEKEVGEELLLTLGGLDVGPGIEKNASALEECGAAHEMLTGGEATRRFPQVTFGDDEEVLFHPDAGIARADRAVESFVALAARAGAEVHENARVAAIEERGEGVVVRTDLETFSAPVAVVTTGAWVNRVLADCGIELYVRVTRETVSYFRSRGPTPPTLVEWREPTLYSLPSPGQGIKAGEHIAGPTADPDEQSPPNDESVQRVSEWIARRFPQADARHHYAETCLYTNTPDEHFILERHGAIVVGSPCSGHGFKFAPLIGKRLAELVGA